MNPEPEVRQMNGGATAERPVVYATEVEKLTGAHRHTVRRWWKSGKWPKPTKIGGRCAWPRSVVMALLGLAPAPTPAA